MWLLMRMIAASITSHNQTDSSGTPPLLRAVMQCKAAGLVQALIDAGADLTVSFSGGVSAVGMA